MPTTTHADPQEQLADFPPILTGLCKKVFERLSACDRKAGDKFLSDISKAAAGEGKDLSRVPWAFLAAELREMPRRSENLERHIDEVIADIDSLASGAEHGSIEHARLDACDWKIASYIDACDVDEAARYAAVHASHAFHGGHAKAVATAIACAFNAHVRAAVAGFQADSVRLQAQRQAHLLLSQIKAA